VEPFMKNLRRLVLVAAASVLCLWVWPLIEEWPVRSASTDCPTIQQIDQVLILTTVQVNVADAMVVRLDGRTGGITTVLVVRGEVTIGVDLSKARLESIDRTNRDAVLVLPQPQVQSVRLDHKTTKLAGLWQTGLWQIVPGDGGAEGAAVDSAFEEAERRVASARNDPALIREAKDRTEQAVQSFAGEMGWRIAVRWTE
jgi:hypothetical protein